MKTSTLKAADGPLMAADGPLMMPDGPLMAADGPLMMPDGPLKAAVCPTAIVNVNLNVFWVTMMKTGTILSHLFCLHNNLINGHTISQNYGIAMHGNMCHGYRSMKYASLFSLNPISDCDSCAMV